MTTAEHLAALIEVLAGADEIGDRWRDALHAVPRHLFVPDRAWWCPDPDDGPGHLIDRSADPDRWTEAVYSNAAIITQRDDGATEIAAEGIPTSSVSAPRIVLAALDLLDPYPADEVLEIGTGQGWTAALLSSVPGVEVTSIEVDPQVAAQAAGNLKTAGCTPRLIVGDGADGWPEGAPYDRVHVTAGVRDIPYTWVTQTRPGGQIVLPWMPSWEAGHLTRLTVTGDGTAVGGFYRGCGYMLLRSQRPVLPVRQGDYRHTATNLDPRRVVRSSTGADVAIAGLIPDLAGNHAEEDGHFHQWLWTEDSDAQVHYSPGHKRSSVLQRGPRDLWDEVEAAYLRWVGWGSPPRDRFGMTVTPEGQHLWLDRPDNTLA